MKFNGKVWAEQCLISRKKRQIKEKFILPVINGIIFKLNYYKLQLTSSYKKFKKYFNDFLITISFKINSTLNCLTCDKIISNSVHPTNLLLTINHIQLIHCIKLRLMSDLFAIFYPFVLLPLFRIENDKSAMSWKPSFYAIAKTFCLKMINWFLVILRSLAHSS